MLFLHKLNFCNIASESLHIIVEVTSCIISTTPLTQQVSKDMYNETPQKA